MTRAHALLLGLILAFAAAVRIYDLSALGFWTDELCTLSEANGHGLQVGAAPTDVVVPPLPVCTKLADANPAWTIVPRLAREDTHPPLYFLLVRLWEQCCGDGEAAVRSLDVCFSVAAVGLLYVAARPDVGPTAALWACLVMAVASPQVQFAQEARNYAPVLTFALGAVVAARRVAAGPSAAASVALAASLLAMMLTHYYAAPVAVALAAHLATTHHGRPLARLTAAFAAAAVAFLVLWGWAVPAQWTSAAGERAWLSDAAPGHVGRALTAAAKLPVRWVADVDPPAAAVGGLLFLALPFAFADRRLRPWAWWVTVPTLVIVAGDAARGTTQATLLRYTLFATPGAVVLIAAAGRRTRWAVPAVAVVGALLAARSAYVPPWKTDFATPVTFVDRNRGPADGLVISGPNPVTAEMTLAAFQHYARGMPPAAAVLTRPADGPTLARLTACPRVWVVWLWPDRPVESFLPGFRTADADRVPHFGTIAVGRVVRPASGPR